MSNYREDGLPPKAHKGAWAGGEGGIRTPDTVARMPHFECGAFNHSATSPRGAKNAQVVPPYLAAAGHGNKRYGKEAQAGWAGSRPITLLQFAPEPAIERIRAAAT
jgi:hypothetical protein